MRILIALSIVVLVSLGASAQEATDGTVREHDEQQQAWDDAAGQWVGLEEFWLRYAERQGGLTWGRRSDYPPYAEVKELDTMIIELEQGPCMMQFFHTRWRRANDVRRWDDAFNKFAGCPYVFD